MYTSIARCCLSVKITGAFFYLEVRIAEGNMIALGYVNG